MTLSADDFRAFHQAIHNKPPFDWQARLLEQVVRERRWPRVLDLPTGTGKTTCLDIALFALALDAQTADSRWCPRRIAMVVDRRVVVDQVAERGRRLLAGLLDPKHPVVQEVASLLRSLSKESREPLGVFTLRGGMPKDDTWARTPDQPLILASTVDQLGSRLLIQGYGVSRGMKPVHAGLLGNDLLLLLDEVHLSQPFAQTLDALDHLRTRYTKAQGADPRFHHAFLSATPTTSDERPFRLLDSDTGPDSALSSRLAVSKPVRCLLDRGGRQELERSCVDEARNLIATHDVIAVVVNRIATACTVARQLTESLRDKAEVVLLTGRMRPLDRDDVLRELRPRIMTGRDRSMGGSKLVVVGTQCIEAGADFDFDALVTEAASLDSLRQRFGRVDRLGVYGKAQGVVIRDKTEKDDPIYGESLANTATWLKGKLDSKIKAIDFGILKFPQPEPEELANLVAPRASAPVLLPAYMDLWMQTSPAPSVVPDASLWLHGPRSGPADVQIVWRADISEGDLAEAQRGADPGGALQGLIAVVGSVRPSSLEAIGLPFSAARRWLAGAPAGEIADVEGVTGVVEPTEAQGLSLRWDGDDSEVITTAQLRPGDTVIVPASRGGIRDASFDSSATEVVFDLAERAALFSRGQPLLRLHPAVLGPLGLNPPLEDLQETRRYLESAADEAPSPWRKLWLERLAKARTSIVVDFKDGWDVLQGRRVSVQTLRTLTSLGDTVEDGVELTTDEDDSFHAGHPVVLSEHSTDVETFARAYSKAAGFQPQLVEDLALAGWLHDIGKADRRFQVLLRGGSEIDFFKDETPWAKSGMPVGAKTAHRRAQASSRYPKGARHEVQSVAMLEANLELIKVKAHDPELVFHLVASHHGYCRPFAPAVVDVSPVEVSLRAHESAVFGKHDFGPTTSANELHRVDSAIADRFWQVVGRYGWHQVCWFEAVLRLADHRASEMEQRAEMDEARP